MLNTFRGSWISSRLKKKKILNFPSCTVKYIVHVYRYIAIQYIYENIQKLVIATREVLTVELDDVVAG